MLYFSFSSYCILNCVNFEEHLHNSVNQYFPDDQCVMILNHMWVKDPFKAQDKSVDFNVIEYEKFIDTALESSNLQEMTIC